MHPLVLVVVALVVWANAHKAAPPRLIFIVCQVDDPSRCEEERIAVKAAGECRGYEAQVRIIRWLDEHPQWQFGGRYACGPGERGT